MDRTRYKLQCAIAVLICVFSETISQQMTNNIDHQQQVMYLLERVGEPVFMPKANGKVFYNVPPELLAERFRPSANNLTNRFGFESPLTQDRSVVNIKPITVPDLSLVMEVPRGEPFSLFLPRHRKAAGRLIKLFMGMRTFDDFLSLAVYTRDTVNKELFVYAFSVALLHRKDTRGLQLPSLTEIFPQKCITSSVLHQAREQARLQLPNQDAIEVPREWTGSHADPENRLAYFREDVGINLHHWHWHLVYPFETEGGIVDKDRRGELFYYMHRQVLARYNVERYCNHMALVERLHEWTDPIPQGYYPKLDSAVASRLWPGRPSNLRLRDINRPDLNFQFDIHDLERWRNRIFEAIHRGAALNVTNGYEPLTEERGTDILGNMIESSILSPHRSYYGDMHNMGHVAIAFMHDPDGTHLESFGIMGETTTAMRDIVFYRWHALIDDIFLEHKNVLPRYDAARLTFPGVRIISADVKSDNLANRNQLATFWQKSDIDLSRGLDFMDIGPVYARVTHLQHYSFTYTIRVENTNRNTVQGTFRIFMAPRFDERGREMRFNTQKNLMLELDKFQRPLTPGVNTIERRSVDSSVTIPYERTFRKIEYVPENANDTVNFCGCGWPQHMLIPKGREEGMQFDLFFMVSNWENDRVERIPREHIPCADAASYCGIRDQKYPDRQSMGFPFDRLARENAATLDDFIRDIPNMKYQRISIVHTPLTV